MGKNQNNNNLIVLFGFAAGFSVVLGASLLFDKQVDTNNEIDTVSAVTTEVVTFNEPDILGTENTAYIEQGTLDAYLVSEYDAAVTMYASDTVNVRSGAGTDFDKVGKLSWGSAVAVTGETDNGWYEVSYNDGVAYILGDYITDSLPSIPYLFVGDSRTVQLQMAVGSTDKEYVAKVGEGYVWFRDTALSEIQQYAGNGTTMIINFGVNDLANASKYIKLVNSHVDEWINAGMTVYYAAVTPVGSSASVSNAQIESFNAKLKEGLDSRIQWIDGYSYLQQTGFNTADGLHYDKSTYKNLYSYYMSVLGQSL